MGISCKSNLKIMNSISPTEQQSVSFVFTRYLYEKEEVKLALLFALLNKKDDAIFWAYELYYSGFSDELVELLWKMYYDFYATLNPKFEKYLLSKKTAPCCAISNFSLLINTTVSLGLTKIGGIGAFI